MNRFERFNKLRKLSKEEKNIYNNYYSKYSKYIDFSFLNLTTLNMIKKIVEKNNINDSKDEFIIDFINIISKYNLIYDNNQINENKLNTFLYLIIQNNYYITKEKLLNGENFITFDELKFLIDNSINLNQMQFVLDLKKLFPREKIEKISTIVMSKYNFSIDKIKYIYNVFQGKLDDEDFLDEDVLQYIFDNWSLQVGGNNKNNFIEEIKKYKNEIKKLNGKVKEYILKPSELNKITNLLTKMNINVDDNIIDYIINNKDIRIILLEISSDLEINGYENFNRIADQFLTNKYSFNLFLNFFLDNCNDINMTKTIIQKLYSFNIYDEDLFSMLSKIPYENITDSLVKNWYDIMKIVLESNDITFIKKTMKKITKAYDSTQILNMAYSMLVKQNVDIALNDLVDKEELKKYPTTYMDEIPIYHIDNSMDFSFLAHVVTEKFIREHPEEWAVDNKTLTKTPTLLSLSKINNWLHELYGTSIENDYISSDGLCLLFEEVPHDQVFKINNYDAGVSRGIFNSNQKLSLDNFNRANILATKQENIPDYHNEVAVQRKLPNGTKRMPFAILVNDVVTLSSNAPAVIWAKYYNIPLVMYHTKKYEMGNEIEEDNKKTI